MFRRCKRPDRTSALKLPIYQTRAGVFGLATLCCFLWGSSYPAIKNGYALLQVAQGDICQSARKKDPLSASKRDPFAERHDRYDGRSIRAGRGVGRA